jgi:Sensors of blue-light using FAD
VVTIRLTPSGQDRSDEAASTMPDTLLYAPDTKAHNKQRFGQMLVCSMVCGKPTETQLKELHEHSARNNRNRGLTGVLLCGDGVFVHWLEGANDYLDEAWQAIVKDSRHEKIVVLWENRDAPERLFGDWVMGLRSTVVARDLLEILRATKRLHTPKAMLRANYYEVFSDSLELLERVCAADPKDKTWPEVSPATNHTLMGPARHVVKAMNTAGFVPYAVRAQAEPKTRDPYAELSSLDTGASSMFKNPVPTEHAALFDMAAEGMDDLLTMLDMPLRIALGKELWSRRKELSERPLHWIYDGKLVAVFDHATWRVGLHPELTSVVFEHAILYERLRSANDIPTQFRQTTTYALLWDYAKSDQSSDLKLPARFMANRIRLRRPPPVPELMLQPGQQQLLALLGKGPERMVDLAQSMGLKPEFMVNLLRPFYAARCIDVVAGASAKAAPSH